MADRDTLAASTSEADTNMIGDGIAPEAAPLEAPSLAPDVIAKITAHRGRVRENFGKIVMAMMMMPRYKRQSLEDLQHLVLEPLMSDRIAIAYPSDPQQNVLADIIGVAIWASVSEEVDARIREQIKAGVFPIRLKKEEWSSGNINWVLDVIAPSQKATTNVIANFRQVAKEGELRIHPIITKLIDRDTLAKMQANNATAPAD